MKRVLPWVFLLSLISKAALGQDPQFSQFYANPLYLNPALAGAAKGPRIAANFRDQWNSISGSFITYSASFDQHIDELGGGVGFQAMYDRAGDGELTTVGGSGIYSYQINVSRDVTVKTGLQAAFMQRSIDFNKLVFPDQIDPNPRLGFTQPTQEPISNNNPQVRFADFSAGAMVFSGNYFGGLAVHHITEPGQSFFTENGEGSNLPRKYTAHAGMVIPLNKYSVRDEVESLTPHVMYQQQAQFNQINFGTSYNHQNFVVGALFRQSAQTSDALIMLLGVKLDQVRIGYSYDATLSDARSAAPGSHEISLVIEWEPKEKPQPTEYRSLECPQF